MSSRVTARAIACGAAITALSVNGTAFAKTQKCLNEKELASLLKAAVNNTDFDQVVDLGPNFTEDPCPPNESACKHGRKPLGVERFPQIDLAVIAFQKGCANPVVGSNVFFSRDFPKGVSAEFDKNTGAVNNVRLQRWTQERFDGGRVTKASPFFEQTPHAWKAPFPPDDLINPEATSSAVNFMSPYPASIFKILVLAKVLTFLEERGPLEAQLEQKFTFDFGTPDQKDDVTLSLREYLDAMIQWSGNKATAAMIQYLHKNGQIVESQVKDEAGYPSATPSRNTLNSLYADLGLPSLQMNRTRMMDGLWGNRDTMYLKNSSSISHISMPSWDVARLLWLLRTNSKTPASELPSWKMADGHNVNPFKISETVKKKFWTNLENQLFHEVLSNTLHCKQSLGGAFGIPARLPAKWIAQNKIKLPVGNFPFTFAPDELKGDYKFSDKILECQKNSEVTFASKTGLTSVSGSQAGLVKGLSERGFQREYIVVLNSSLGSRFTDSERLDSERVIPCFDKTLCYTKRINQLGANIDNSLKGWLESNERSNSSTRFAERKTKVR
ncbi:MAG: hypothetical protein RI953_2666 [Pseudomonadota bacterium]|jgi:hypothetical protein